MKTLPKLFKEVLIDLMEITQRRKTTVWLILAFLGGYFNVTGILIGAEVVSHVTGLITQAGLLFGEWKFKKAFYLMSFPLFFLLGGMVSGYLVDLKLQSHKEPKYRLALGFMLGLLVLVYLSFFVFYSEDSQDFHHYFIISSLCFICGIQNALITIVSKSVIRTTHLTGTTTDLSVGLVRLIFKNRIKTNIDMKMERFLNRTRFLLIIFFILGALVGGVLFSTIVIHALLLPILLLILILRMTKHGII